MPLSVVTGGDKTKSRVEGWIATLYDNRYLIFSVVLLTVFASVLYWMASKPVFQANMLIHVAKLGKGPDVRGSGELGPVPATSTTSNAEVEMLRSHLVISKAHENLNVHATAEPLYFPVVGRWLAGRNWKLPLAGGAGGYAWGRETLTLQLFSMPEALLNEEVVVTATGEDRFTLRDGTGMVAGAGKVGMPLALDTVAGPIKLLITRLEAGPGVRFVLIQRSKLALIQAVQGSLEDTEVGM